MGRTIHSARYKRLLAALREAREAKGVSQVELAERLKKTQTFVSKIERGERRLDVIETFLYLEALELDPLPVLAALRQEM